MSNNSIELYENNVLLKYKIFNGLFLNLPFSDIDDAGARLSIFAGRCETGLSEGQNPQEIVETYLKRVNVPHTRQLDLLFKFIQFIERQIVLFDALEDAAFKITHNLSGKGSLDNFIEQILDSKKNNELTKLLKSYKIRIVLTAHPTQFYPNPILGIILQMSTAIRENNLPEIQNLFLQMGYTRFKNKNKPTPTDEAKSLIWYLKHIIYNSIPNVQKKLISFSPNNTNIEIGFWPGGDRDGNPFVTANVTLDTATELKQSIIQLYHEELIKLTFRLTFDGVLERIRNVALRLKNHEYLTAEQLITELKVIRELLVTKYRSLFIDDIDILITKINVFGFYFAKIDIRQNSRYHEGVINQIFMQNKICTNYLSLNTEDKIKLITTNLKNQELLKNINISEEVKEQLNTIEAIYQIQNSNGVNAVERYIISNTETVANIFEVLLLINLVNAKFNTKDANFKNHQIKIEIVPLFETIKDLTNSVKVMETLYNNQIYSTHLQSHNMQQTIMLGFSDGTKDGGYLKANWSIYLAKKELSKLSRKYGVNVIFFDGRGGPPARGGGDTRNFYRAIGKNIELNQIQLTIQGQTIYSNFGTIESAMYNTEQLFTSGLLHKLFPNTTENITSAQEKIITELADTAYNKYMELKHHELFISYLEEISTLKYLSELNIGSRPAKRNKDDKLQLEELRAIPFVGAWTQLKQNILGFYGVGYAIEQYIKTHQNGATQLQKLYKESLFFKALINNAMQSLTKSNFTITNYLATDKKFKHFWHMLKDEATLSTKMLLNISKHKTLLETNQVSSSSIALREKIIVPLLVIQQFAMMKLRDKNTNNREVYEKLVLKTLAANINASRNSI